MRFGVCTPIENLPLLAAAGYDYIEPALSGVVKAETPADEVMPKLHSVFDNSSIKPETWNVMLPGDLKVVGEIIDRDRQQRYLDTAYSRAAALGAKIVVFGSGGARNIPEGFSPSRAMQQLIDFTRLAGEAAANHGVTVAIEPLNTKECNLINSVGEASQLSKAVGSNSVMVLSDLYHIVVEDQDYEETTLAGQTLQHVHVAGLADRRAPIAEDREFLIGYFRALRAGGYDSRVSVEGKWENLEAQAAETLQILKEAWEKSAD